TANPCQSYTQANNIRTAIRVICTAGLRGSQGEVYELRRNATNLDWMFLSNHAHVLICIAQEPEVRLREFRCRSIFSRGGRPRQRGSRTMPRRWEMTSTQSSAPEGRPLRTDDRTPSNSLDGCSPRTLRRQRARRSGSVRPGCSHSGNESRMGSACPAPRQRWLDQVYSHGSATIAARIGLASMYLRTTSRWWPSWTTGDRKRPCQTWPLVP